MRSKIRAAFIAPCKRYETAWNFHEGLATVKLDGKWGFINTEGTKVVPFKHDYCGSFSEGFYAVYLDRKYGFIGIG